MQNLIFGRYPVFCLFLYYFKKYHFVKRDTIEGNIDTYSTGIPVG